MFPVKPAGKSAKPVPVANRYAVLLYDDLKGIVEAVVCFEDGRTELVRFPPPRLLHSPWVMAESLNAAQHALMELHRIPTLNIRSHSASLEHRSLHAGRYGASRSRFLAR
jgi:hypothetical protein